MKKILSIVIGLVLVGSLALADQAVDQPAQNNLIKDKLTVSAIYNYSDKDIDTDFSQKVQIGSFGLEQVTSIDEVKMYQTLADIEYAVNDYIKPFVQLGSTWLDYNLNSDLTVSVPWTSATVNLMKLENDCDGAFTYAFGSRGRVLEAKKFVLGYDVRRLAFNTDSEVGSNLLPSIIPIPITAKGEVEYVQWDFAVKLSRPFEVDKIVQTITPMIGYKLTNVSMKIKNDIGINGLPINLNTENDIDETLHSLLLGVSAQITDNWSASVEGSLFGDKGVLAKASYKF